ncbi:MAG: methyltransferase type 11 [Candidatus Anoxymicrobium japonicum]|uniref:Methyltransferase type 11 n=1 Tax=Candidatus Anoxymicrobium japonicum TaxID=2013648 RepID=A0A2N3G6G0_9ACTN|nr:MAG: methyltransferase type 11 [Candidatus Anoxymicrobium japonicum]
MTDNLAQTPLRLSEPVRAALRCPACQNKLMLTEDRLRCTGERCAIEFPIVNGVPVLINERNSLFAIDDFVQQRDTFFDLHESRLKKTVEHLIPGISRNVRGRQNYARLAELLLKQVDAPRVLVVGCGMTGEGIESLAAQSAIEIVNTDVSFAPQTALICDAHDLPFDDGAFDCVIAQAVLEYVVDPYRCAAEFYRVLGGQGLVYAETPFMQQVHGGRYDFTRFTHLGHRRLFRNFEEIDSGAIGGPGMALAWAYQYFLWSFVKSKLARKALQAFAGLTAFYLKFFDGYLIDKPGALDAAAGCYFLGRKSTRILTDRELIQGYRGAFS